MRQPKAQILSIGRLCLTRDANGQALAYVEGELDRRAAAHLLTRDEARRIAANVAKLPEPRAVRHQKLPAAFSGPARCLRRRRAIR